MNPTYVGKVRDVYDLGEILLLVASDRISAFDVVFDEHIPDKGKILTRISNLWFDSFPLVPNHILETNWKSFPKPFDSISYSERSVLVRKAKRIDFECVVRGYLSGSAFKEYKSTGQIAGIPYPEGIAESQKLDEPIFTPARKKDSGHDENVPESVMREELGSELFFKLKNMSLYLYKEAAKKVQKVGLILCDTKFEFGIWNGEPILIDELLTPDSSRYWESSDYKLGISPPSLDKQVLRNWLEKTTWNKLYPPPALPETLITEIKQKYEELEQRLIKCLSQK